MIHEAQKHNLLWPPEPGGQEAFLVQTVPPTSCGRAVATAQGAQGVVWSPDTAMA